MANERYTPIGCGLWSWQPWVARGSDARLLWLALYTSPGSKRSVPGLWPGTLHGMSDDSHLTLNQTYNALDELVAAKMVEFDQEHRLARLTALPDAHDRAHNSQALSGWWTRFCSLPKCALRDAAVGVLWWMVAAGRPVLEGRTEEQKLSLQKGWNKMIATWRNTFGTIDIPKATQSYQPLSSNDTGTKVQPSLFGLNDISMPKAGSNEISHSDPRPMDQPTMPHGPDPDQDLDLPESGGGGSGEGSANGRANVVPGPWRLQLVPVEPEPDPGIAAAEAGNERQREMRQVMAEAAGVAGIGWIVPKEPA